MSITPKFYRIAMDMLESIRNDYNDDVSFFDAMHEVVDNSKYAIYPYYAQRLIVDEMSYSQQAQTEWELEQLGESSNTLTYNEFACLIACHAIKNVICSLADAEEVEE